MYHYPWGLCLFQHHPSPTHTVSGQLFYILYVFMNFKKYALFTQWNGIALSSGGICIYKCF